MRWLLEGLVIIVVGSMTFLTTVKAFSQQEVPGVTIMPPLQMPPMQLPPIEKRQLTIECALNQEPLSNLMKAEKFRIIATKISDENGVDTIMVMLNPQGHVLVVNLINNEQACIVANLGEGTMISHDLQLYLKDFTQAEPPAKHNNW